MWDIKCIASALCFLTSNVLFLVRGYLAAYASAHAQSVMAEKNGDGATTDAGGPDYNYEYWRELDPTYVEYRWMERESHRPLMISASVSSIHFLGGHACLGDIIYRTCVPSGHALRMRRGKRDITRRARTHSLSLTLSSPSSYPYPPRHTIYIYSTIAPRCIGVVLDDRSHRPIGLGIEQGIQEGPWTARAARRGEKTSAFARSFVVSFVGWLVRWLVRSLFVRSFLRSFVPSFVHSFVPSFVRSFASFPPRPP